MGGESRSVVVNVPPDEFYKVITDYNSYSDFLSSVTKSEVVKSAGNTSEVYFELNLIKTIKYTLKMSAEAPKRVVWSLIKGDLFKVNNGSWELEAMDNGRATKATYTTEVEFTVFVPKMITNKLASVSLPSTLKEFKERAEKRLA